MRPIILAVAVLLGACAAKQPGASVGVLPASAMPPQPAATGSPEAQAARELRQGEAADTRAAQLQAADPLAPRPSGEQTANPYDIGAAGQLPPQPQQVAPVFRRF
jgi:hypothetical protein